MKNNRGTTMLLALGVLAITTILVSAMLAWFHATFDYANNQEARQVCAHIAEAGLDKALAERQSGNRAYDGETGTPFGSGSFSVTVADSSRPGWIAIESIGELPRGAKVVRKRLRKEVRLDADGRVDALEWREAPLNE